MLTIFVTALRPLIEEAASKLVHESLTDTVNHAARWLINRYADPSGKLPAALTRATDRAWRAVEVGLAGPSLLQKLVERGEDRGFRRQVQQFVEVTPLEDLGIDRRQVLSDLARARRSGEIPAPAPPADAVAVEATRFLRFAPDDLIESEFRAVASLGPHLRKAGYLALARFVELRPSAGSPLIAIAVRYFFSREISADPSLLGDLTYARVGQISDTLRAGLDGLAEAIDGNADALAATLDVLAGLRADVFDLKAEQQRQAGDLRAIYEGVKQAGDKLDRLHERALRPADGFSIRSEDERALIRRVVAAYRRLTEEDRRGTPALLDAIGKLEHAAGDFDDAAKDFSRAAEIVNEPEAKAIAHLQAFRAEVEGRRWDEALSHLAMAVEAGGPAYRLFPTDTYIPTRILGAGGFGTVFLCQNRFLKKDVVVKALTTDDLDRDVDAVFEEARVLEDLSHPVLIRLRDCGCTDGDPRRPFIVMEYFAAMTLDELVRTKGPLPPRAVRAVGRMIAEGLHAAHRQKILHRDVKPGNVLLRRAEADGDPAVGWELKLIDFGLAVRIRARTAGGGSGGQSILGRSIAGTLKFAAPEQIGELGGVSVSPRSDVYGLGASLCFALFGTPRPSRRQWRQVDDEPLAELLDECLSDQPSDRPELDEVLSRLAPDSGGGVRVDFDPPEPARGPEAIDRSPADLAESRPVEQGSRAPDAQPAPAPESGQAVASQTGPPRPGPSEAIEPAPAVQPGRSWPESPSASRTGDRPYRAAYYPGTGPDGGFRGIGAQLLRASRGPGSPDKPAGSKDQASSSEYRHVRCPWCGTQAARLVFDGVQTCQHCKKDFRTSKNPRQISAPPIKLPPIKTTPPIKTPPTLGEKLRKWFLGE